MKGEAGRFHQIRVQFASARHPLFGDPKYGGGLSKQGEQLALENNGDSPRCTTRAIPICAYVYAPFYTTE